MLERMTEQAHAAIRRADETARRYKSSYVGTEFLLLAFLEQPTCIVSRILQEQGADIDALKANADAKIRHNLGLEKAGEIGEGKIPHTPSLKRLFPIANDEARNQQVDYVGSGHFFLALFDTQGCDDRPPIATTVLRECGLQLEAARASVSIHGNQEDSLAA